MGTYKHGTIKALKALRSGEGRLSAASKGVTVVSKTGDIIYRAADQKQEAGKCVLGRLSADEKKQEFAHRIGISPSVLAKITNESDSRKASRDHILCAFLNSQPIPSAEELKEALKKGGYPFLDEDTVYLQANRRNFLINRCFEFARQNACPSDSWVQFVNSVIAHFNSLYPRQQLSLLSNDIGVVSLPSSVETVISEWEKAFAAITVSDVMPLRLALKARYLEAHPTEERRFVTHVTELTGDNGANISRWFSPQKPIGYEGSRALTLRIAVAVGANLKETNRLLRLVHEPIVYPNGDDEAYMIESLLRQPEDSLV